MTAEGKFDKVDILKTGLSLVTGVGIGRIVGGGIQMVAPQTNLPGKIAVYVAKVGISGALAATVDAHNNATIDTFVKAFKRSSDQIKDAK